MNQTSGIRPLEQTTTFKDFPDIAKKWFKDFIASAGKTHQVGVNVEIKVVKWTNPKCQQEVLEENGRKWRKHTINGQNLHVKLNGTIDLKENNKIEQYDFSDQIKQVRQFIGNANCFGVLFNLSGQIANSSHQFNPISVWITQGKNTYETKEYIKNIGNGNS